MVIFIPGGVRIAVGKIGRESKPAPDRTDFCQGWPFYTPSKDSSSPILNGDVENQRALQISIINSTNYSISINTIFHIAGFQIDWPAAPMDPFPLADQEEKGPPRPSLVSG